MQAYRARVQGMRLSAELASFLPLLLCGSETAWQQTIQPACVCARSPCDTHTRVRVYANRIVPIPAVLAALHHLGCNASMRSMQQTTDR